MTPVDGFSRGVGLALMLCGFVSASAASAEECHRYGAVVTMSGRYQPETVQENTASNPGPTFRRRADLLFPNAPFCVSADVLSAGVQDAASIQLHCPLIRALDGATISVTGRLFGAHTGNGHVPVILACTS